MDFSQISDEEDKQKNKIISTTKNKEMIAEEKDVKEIQKIDISIKPKEDEIILPSKGKKLDENKHITLSDENMNKINQKEKVFKNNENISQIKSKDVIKNVNISYIKTLEVKEEKENEPLIIPNQELIKVDEKLPSPKEKKMITK